MQRGSVGGAGPKRVIAMLRHQGVSGAVALPRPRVFRSACLHRPGQLCHQHRRRLEFRLPATLVGTACQSRSQVASSRFLQHKQPPAASVYTAPTIPSAYSSCRQPTTTVHRVPAQHLELHQARRGWPQELGAPSFCATDLPCCGRCRSWGEPLKA